MFCQQIKLKSKKREKLKREEVLMEILKSSGRASFFFYCVKVDNSSIEKEISADL